VPYRGKISYQTAITRLSIKRLFYDTIEQICRRIKGYTNTKENTFSTERKKHSALLPFAMPNSSETHYAKNIDLNNYDNTKQYRSLKNIAIHGHIIIIMRRIVVLMTC